MARSPGIPVGADRREVVQVAYVVDDIWRGAETWHRLTGAGPFFVREHIPIETATTADGQPAVFDHSSACGQWGDVMIELVTHHDLGPDVMASAMRRPPGVHHVAWFVDDLDEERHRLETLGGTTVLEAATGDIRFGFFEVPGMGHLVECYQPNDYLRELYDAVRHAAQRWDGSRPVRLRDEL